MIIALTYVGISFFALIVLTFFYVMEDIHGKRVFLAGFRARLDEILASIMKAGHIMIVRFTNGFMRVLFHYGAHSILKRLLATLRRLEAKVEELVRKNRTMARNLRTKTRNHLDEIAEHKEEVALSDKEKENLMSH